MERLHIILFGVPVILVYFLPGIVARLRRHNSVNAIALTNLFFGWTGIGWIIALIWASTGNTAPRGQ
jgi:hypothetical protein